MRKLIALLVFMVIAATSYAQIYKVYKTQNYHNQLRLNTMTGEVQQIQDDGQSWEICSAREILGDREGYRQHLEQCRSTEYSDQSEGAVHQI